MIEALALTQPSGLLHRSQEQRWLRVLENVWARVAVASLAFRQSLVKYVGHRYDRAALNEALEDDDVKVKYRAFVDANAALHKEYPRLTSVTSMPKWIEMRLIFPRKVLRHPLAGPRVQRAFGAMFELAKEVERTRPWFVSEGEPESARGLATRLVVTNEIDLLTAVFDPSLPTEIARGAYSVVIGRLIFEMIREARRTRAWSTDDICRAYVEWAECIEIAAGVIVGITGLKVPSLPHERVLDFEDVLKRHEERRARFAASAEVALRDLDSK